MGRIAYASECLVETHYCERTVAHIRKAVTKGIQCTERGSPGIAPSCKQRQQPGNKHAYFHFDPAILVFDGKLWKHMNIQVKIFSVLTAAGPSPWVSAACSARKPKKAPDGSTSPADQSRSLSNNPIISPTPTARPMVRHAFSCTYWSVIRAATLDLSTTVPSKS